MNNSLDKIECTPILPGSIPPYKITSHPYCIDVITSYFQIEKLKFSQQSNFLKNIEEYIKLYCQSNRIDFEYHFNNKLPLTIPATVNNFQWFLAIQIISFDTNKIKALLSFQQKRFFEEETDFTTFVEFAVYNILKNFTQIDNSEHLKIIMEWVNEQRALDKNHKLDDIIIKTKEQKNINRASTKKSKRDKIKTVQASLSLIGFKNNPQYFVKNAINILEAFQLLKGGGFIPDGTNYEYFKNIFQNKEIKREQRIEWSGKIIDLKMFIDLLMKDKILKIKLNKWDTVSNCFVKNGMDLLPISIRKSNGKLDNQQKLIDLVQLF